MKHKILYTLLAWCVSLGLAFAQGRVVSGTVTDASNGEGLPGVSVYLKGTTTGIATDADGKFQLTVPNASGDILVISLLGYNDQEITLGAEAEIKVALASNASQLGEVVVTALGIEKEKKGLGIAVTELKAADIQNTRSTNLVNSLSARVAGVRVQGSNGMVGSSSAIFIRGFTTFTGSNQPLFVIDGIPIDNSGGGNELQTGVSNSNRGLDINPDDIESMSILKGPAAAVLYGSRAAAGAIMITTKKGKAGKMKVDLSTSYQVSNVNRFPDYQNSYGQGSGGLTNTSPTVAAISPFSWGPAFGTVSTFPNYLAVRQNPNDPTSPLIPNETYQAYPNNVRDLFNQGNNLQNSLTISGGNEKNSFNASYSNTRENGIIKNNFLNRNTFRITGTSQLTNKFSAGLSLNYINTYSTRTQQGNQLSNPFFRSWFLPRSVNAANYPLNNPNGTPNSWFDGADNPLWTIENNKYQDEVNRVLGNINLAYDFTDWLTLTYKLGTDYTNFTANTYDAPGARGAANHNVNGAGAIGKRVNQTMLISSFLNLTAKKKINDDFNLYVLLGQELNEIRNVNRFALGSGVGVTGFENISNATTYNATNAEALTRLMGVYLNAQLTFRNFLFLDVSGRNDRSSTFTKGNNSYFYPSASLSFVVTDAISALKDNPILSFAKIRTNLARVGRVAPAYSTNTYFYSTGTTVSDGFGPTIQFPFNNLPGFTYDNTLGIPDLQPEFTVTREIGTELKFLKNRISVDLGYFSTKSSNIILAVPIASASGFNSVVRNAGVLQTNGIELLLSGTPIKKENFQWDVSLNWTRIRNNVKELAPGVTVIGLGGFTTPQTRLEANAPYGVIYGSAFVRHTDGRMLIGTNGLPSLQPTIQKIGDPNPDWTAGLTNTLTYKGFSFSFLLDFRKGGDIFSRNIGDLRRTGAVVETGDRERTYIVPGVKTNALGQVVTDASGNAASNDIQITAEQYWGGMFGFGIGESYIFDGSWVRLREASLTYSLPKSLISRAKLSNVEIGVSGRNLLLWAPNAPHIDPEVNAQGASNSQGLEFNALPQTRNMGFVLRISY
ncbi:MAG: SusC/RagA family TonB-linked outer membrane protein [Bacteroidetes bacterium]|nr:MAG: SusC/RagA family TonB-linked outer membrane protein [Bacteroidota bacterium]